MSNAILSLGTSVASGATPIAEVTSIVFSGGEREDIDVTYMGSTASAQEFIAGILAGASVQIGLNFLPQNASQQNLLSSMKATDSTIFATYTITWSNGTAWSFSAHVTSLGAVAKYDDKLTANPTFKICRSISIT